ncbi:MAG TPA: hypothetical protein VKS21_10160 [Spirochaetota bacterium]|nr:hypothetical protein [Spirochaetota bacterium]
MRFIKYIIIFTFCVTALTAEEGTEEPADAFFKSGLKKFLKGDLPGAIKNFEDALDEDPGHRQAEKALITAYTTYGKKMFDNKNYQTSKKTFTKLRELDKRNETAEKYLARIKELGRTAQKDFKKEKLKSLATEKSQIEKELEQKQQQAEARGQGLNDTEKKQLQNERITKLQRIIVESKEEGVDNEALDSFIETLKEMKKSEDTSLDKIIALQQEKDRQLAEARAEQEKKDFWNSVIVYSLLGVLALVLGWVAWFIIKVFQRRAKVAESTYKFTAEREAKVLEVMNNVANLDRRSDRSFQIGTDIKENKSKQQIEDATSASSAGNSQNNTGQDTESRPETAEVINENNSSAADNSSDSDAKADADTSKQEEESNTGNQSGDAEENNSNTDNNDNNNIKEEQQP